MEEMIGRRRGRKGGGRRQDKREGRREGGERGTTNKSKKKGTRKTNTPGSMDEVGRDWTTAPVARDPQRARETKEPQVEGRRSRRRCLRLSTACRPVFHTKNSTRRPLEPTTGPIPSRSEEVTPHPHPGNVLVIETSSTARPIRIENISASRRHALSRRNTHTPSRSTQDIPRDVTNESSRRRGGGNLVHPWVETASHVTKPGRGNKIPTRSRPGWRSRWRSFRPFITLPRAVAS